MTKPTNVRWRVLGIIMASSAVGYVMRSTISIAAPSIKTEFGLTESQLGLVMSAFVTTYAIGQIPGGLIGERFGARRVMTWLVAGWGIATLLTGLLPGHGALSIALAMGALMVLRGAMGFLQAPMFPVMTGNTVMAWLPSRQWAFANAVQNTAYTVASAGAAPLMVWLLTAYGWRMLFIVGAPLGLMLAALWWFETRDTPDTHPRVNDAERAHIHAGIATELRSGGAGWLAVVKDRGVVLLTLSYFCMNYVFYLFFNWFYYYLTEVRHLSPKLAGYFTGAQWIIGAVAALAGGILCDSLSARYGATRGCRLTVVPAILFAAPCLVIGALVANPIANLVLLSLSFAATQLVDSAYWVAAMRIAGPRAQLSTGILNTGGNLAGSLAALLVPIIAGAWGWVAGIASGVVFCLLAALLWLGISADRTISAA